MQEAPINPQPNDHSRRHIVLPSGRSIEVIHFQDTADRPGLHICGHCDSELVQPVAWTANPEGRWKLTLECPNCWRTVEGTFGRDQIHALEEHLDDGVADLLADLKRLSHANMAEHVDRFVTALQSDLILPEDF